MISPGSTDIVSRHALSRTEDGLVFLVPIDLLFTEDLRKVGKSVPHATEAFWHQNRVWADISCGRLMPHVHLYQFFQGIASLPTDYVDWYRSAFVSRGLEPELGDGRLLPHRHAHYRQMCTCLQTFGASHPSFTIDVSFQKDQSKFFVLDGHHRAMFLRATGMRRVQARMSEQDAHLWLDADRVNATKALFQAQNRKLIYTPILHPAFYDVVPERDFAYRSRLDIILEHFGQRRFRSPIVDIGSNIGFYVQHLQREGVDAIGYEPFAEHYEMACSLAELFGLPASFKPAAFESASHNEIYSGALLLSVFYHVLARGEHDAFLRALDRSVSEFVIWESGHDPEEEKRLITTRTHFKGYTRLASTYGTERARELGVFHA